MRDSSVVLWHWCWCRCNTDTAWLDVEKIRTKYKKIMALPAGKTTRGAADADDDDDDDEEDTAPTPAAGSKAKPSPSVARKSTGNPAPRPKRKSTVTDSSGQTTDDEDTSSSSAALVCFNEPNKDPSGSATTNDLKRNGHKNTKAQKIVDISDQLSSAPAKNQKHQYQVFLNGTMFPLQLLQILTIPVEKRIAEKASFRF
jgi:hypothetical protein